MPSVALFATCLVDQLRPQVGLATARVLERVGVDVTFDPRQTCCSQPAFNSGYRQEARSVALHFLDVFRDAEVIVTPSGSCAAMVKHMAELFEPGSDEHARAESVAARTHELAAYLVRELNVDDLGARYDGSLTWHDACHGLRDLGLSKEPRRLLAKVQGATFVEMEAADTCCGFGGTFSVKYPEISLAILDRKLERLHRLNVDAIVSSDASCLMQLQGRMSRTASRVRTLHLAQVLAGVEEFA
jgi:L-lactate dehydrogenase complex protein LldE